MTVYLLSIEPPLHHARHYLGWCERDVLGRFDRHLAGDGARIIRAAVQAGRQIKIVCTWPGADRHFERKLKNRKDVSKWCPHCQQHKRPLPRWS